MDDGDDIALADGGGERENMTAMYVFSAKIVDYSSSANEQGILAN